MMATPSYSNENNNNNNQNDNQNHLTVMSLPKEWQDFDAKKDGTSRVVDTRRFEHSLLRAADAASTELLREEDTYTPPPLKLMSNNNNNLNNNFDTIVDVDGTIDDGLLDPNKNELIVSLDLDFSWKDNNKKEKEQQQQQENRRRVQIHLNRDATEISSRAFKRLEISVAKKLSSFSASGSTAKKKKKKKKRKKGIGGAATGAGEKNNNNCVVMNNNDDEPSSRLFTKSSSSDDDDDEINTDEFTAIELCQNLAISSTTSTTSSSKIIGLELSIPVEENDDDEDAADNNNENGASSPTQLQFQVYSNPPVVLTAQTFESFRSKLFVGIPVVVQTTLLHATRAEVSWFVNSNDNEEEAKEELLVLRDSHSFVPQSHHIGKTLSVVIRPINGKKDDSVVVGKTEAYRFHNVIEELPRMPIVSPLRDEFSAMKNKENSIIRMCTYNILADLYVSKKGIEDDGTTTYPHVKYEHVDKTRRIPMIVGELLSYDPDVICLQEVDGSVYDAYLQPVFQAMGYDGYYSNKASSQREGCAMFWSRSMFEIDDDDEELSAFSVRDLFGSSKDGIFEREWNSMKEINALLKSHKELRKVTMEKLGQVLQIATLKLRNPKEGQPKKMVVGKYCLQFIVLTRERERCHF